MIGREQSSNVMDNKINDRLYEAVVKQMTERYGFEPENDAQLLEFREFIRSTIELYTDPEFVPETPEELQ